MKIVLLSGGSGKRLWPLSNAARSKQFLKVLQNEAGKQESMLQRIWRQLKSTGFVHSAYISTNESQKEIIQNQLGLHDVPVIVEPQKKDTFPAIALASVYLYSVLNVKMDELICVLPVDLYVDESFFHLFEKMEASLLKSNACLALVGIKPTYPSENYGYIIPNQGTHGVDPTAPYVTITRFIEKPNKEAALELIKQKAFWNSGVFAFRLEYMIELLSEKQLPLQYNELLEKYSDLPQRSFDYEVAEKAHSVIALPYDGDWFDLGTWDSLTNRMASPIIGNGIIAGESNNTHLINELGIPVIVNDISNGIVVISSDGVFVSEKSTSHQVKDLTASFHQRLMYEEKRWGWYRVLDYSKLENQNEVLTKRLKIMSGKNLSYQFHMKRAEIWTIISGKGEIILDGQFRFIESGDVVHIPQKLKHAVRAVTELEIIEVQMGSALFEEDIVRLYFTWEEIEGKFRESQ